MTTVGAPGLADDVQTIMKGQPLIELDCRDGRFMTRGAREGPSEKSFEILPLQSAMVV